MTFLVMVGHSLSCSLTVKTSFQEPRTLNLYYQNDGLLNYYTNCSPDQFVTEGKNSQFSFVKSLYIWTLNFLQT